MSRPNQITRRQFIRSTGVATAMAGLPALGHFGPTAWGQVNELFTGAGQTPGPESRVLVVIQLAGGNDGLNTVIPYGVRAYYRARPRIAIGAQEVLKLDQSEGIGLHPELVDLKRMIDDGMGSIIQGVGYPNQNRSHRGSTSVWETGMNPVDDVKGASGWLSDAMELLDPERRALRGVALGRELPLAMMGSIDQSVVIQNPQLCRWAGWELNEALKAPYERLQAPEGESPANAGVTGATQLAHVTRVSRNNRVMGQVLRDINQGDSLTSFPGGPLADQLRLVAGLMRAAVPATVFFVTMKGFDTHTSQVDQHAQNLWQFAVGVRAFYDELIAMEQDHRVLTMVFSEFGRQVKQNASDGTDHGSAGPMFLFGPMVQPGLIGTHPGLADLDNGGLRHTTDFRSVYASILNRWLQVNSSLVLEESFKPLPILKT